MKDNTKTTVKGAKTKPEQVSGQFKGIVIGKNWKLGADSMNIILYHLEVNKKTKEERWRVYGYFATITGALTALINQGVRDTQLVNIKIVCDKIDHLQKDISKVMNMMFQDKPRNNRDLINKISNNNEIDSTELDRPNIDLF
jgi:hypothetical protein